MEFPLRLGVCPSLRYSFFLSSGISVFLSPFRLSLFLSTEILGKGAEQEQISVTKNLSTILIPRTIKLVGLINGKLVDNNVVGCLLTPIFIREFLI